MPPSGRAHPPRASVGSIFLNFDGSAAHGWVNTQSARRSHTDTYGALTGHSSQCPLLSRFKAMVGSALFARTLRCCTYRGCQCEQLPSEASTRGTSQPAKRQAAHSGGVAPAGSPSSRQCCWRQELEHERPGASAEVLSGVLSFQSTGQVSRLAPGLLCCAAKLGSRVMAGLHACRAAALGCLLIDRPGSASHRQCVFKAWGAWADQSQYPQAAPRSDAAPERGACAGPTRPGGAPCPGRSAPCCCRPASGGRGARAASA
jgi:hypothetical protein